MNNAIFNPANIGGYTNMPSSSFAPTWNATTTPNSNNLNNIKVNGIESVKAYPMLPNSKVVLFDANEDIFYIKETDVSNYPTIRIFGFQELKAPEEKSTEFVTLDEFNKFKEEILNGQQYIREYVRESINAGGRAAGIEDNEYSTTESKSTTDAPKSNKSKSSI